MLKVDHTVLKNQKKSRFINRYFSTWRTKHHTAFTSLVQATKMRVTLERADPGKGLYFLTDASPMYWSGVFTQVLMSELNSGKEPQQWAQEPLVLISGPFRHPLIFWTTLEKDSYVFVTFVAWMAHILVVCPKFSLLTDHKNILYMIDPSYFQANVAWHIVHEVQWWVPRLSEFNITVKHTPGKRNVWADMLTRWAASSNATFSASWITAFHSPLITSPAETPDFS